MLERAKEKPRLYATISPSQYRWIGTGAGKRDLSFNYLVRQHEANVELYIDRGKDAGEENKVTFDRLIASKGNVESAFGEALEWERLGGYRDNEAKWPAIQDAMIDAMVRLERALKPCIAKLQV